jgi:putative transposase
MPLPDTPGPLDEPHFLAALRYTELNPVRAEMVAEPEADAWSSAAAHCGFVPVDEFLDTRLWQESWTCATWRDYLADPVAEADADAIR